MIVVDALVHEPSLVERLLDRGNNLAVPHLMDVEVAHALRRLVATEKLPADVAAEALADYAGLPVTRYTHTWLLPRAWELRDNVTAYDGIYIALAEAFDAPLWTRDVALAKAPGHDARVEVV